ncbi:MAG: AlpA family transcriptional regulator [Methylophaga sp.]|nr:MAG: AlpA family transcriptional regulator [Methylophaga sp.]
MEQQILRLKEVSRLTGLSGSTIYDFMKERGFPKQIKLGVRSSGWVASEVQQWIEDRIAASRTEAAA